MSWLVSPPPPPVPPVRIIIEGNLFKSNRINESALKRWKLRTALHLAVWSDRMKRNKRGE